MNKLYLIIAIGVLVVSGLAYSTFQFVTNFRPNFSCGADSYYIFPDVEGVDVITNSSNTEFKYDLFPSMFYRNAEEKFPYRVYFKYNNSQYINYIGKDSNLEMQIANLKNCYPNSTAEIKNISTRN